MNLKEYVRAGKGAADITPLLGDGEAFGELVRRLAGLVSGLEAEKIVCIDGRGLMLGSAVAHEMKLGLVPVRVAGKLKNEVYSREFVDYSGEKKSLEIHKDGVREGEKVVIVDDWLETGATVKAAIGLVEDCGGRVAGIAAFMDDTRDELKEELKKYNYRFLERTGPEDVF